MHLLYGLKRTHTEWCKWEGYKPFQETDLQRQELFYKRWSEINGSSGRNTGFVVKKTWCEQCQYSSTSFLQDSSEQFVSLWLLAPSPRHILFASDFSRVFESQASKLSVVAESEVDLPEMPGLKPDCELSPRGMSVVGSSSLMLKVLEV